MRESETLLRPSTEQALPTVGDPFARRQRQGADERAECQPLPGERAGVRRAPKYAGLNQARRPREVISARAEKQG